jgi:hypothetical protein
VPHKLLSSRTHLRKAELEGSRATETYDETVRKCQGGNAVTHLVQIVNQPGQVVALEVWYMLPIFLPAKEVVELVRKLRRRFVKPVELLQYWKSG